ncbi:MAG: ABC transporter permease [Christensenellales bacterium]|jgi:ribose transport system permease protein
MQNSNGAIKKNKEIKKIDMSLVYTALGLVALIIILSIASPFFLRGENLNNIFLQMSINGIVAIGMTFVIITGGIDISVGSIVAVAGILYGIIFKELGGNNILTLLGTLLCGAVLGSVNGLLISKGKLPAYITTLGMMQVARGLSLLLSGSRPISGYSDTLIWIGGGNILGIATPIWIMVIVYVIAFLILRYTMLGRNLYAIGGNREASRLSGINIDRVIFAAYVISGLLAGLAAIVLTGRLNTATPQAGEKYEMDAIASVVIGGASLAGGRGNVIGTFIGALIISVVRNGMNILNVNTYLQQILLGAIIIGAVFIDAMRGNRE